MGLIALGRRVNRPRAPGQRRAADVTGGALPDTSQVRVRPYNGWMRDPSSALLVGKSVKAVRVALGWTQRELAIKAGVSQAYVCLIENGRVSALTFEAADRLLIAMGARLSISVDRPFLGDRERQRELAHARCSAHIANRLRRAGWEVATEVEIGSDRSRGWIDVIAWHPTTRWLLVIEIKTEIHDLGAIERSLGWYEREAWAAARRRGWVPKRAIGCLMLLATDANELRARANRVPLTEGFAIRAADLARLVEGDSADSAANLGDLNRRAMTMIDPLSRRSAWLRPLQIDGRRSPAPYADYADFIRAMDRGRRGAGNRRPGR
jgi:transcriptional regulator with XRE-family HTH domain